MESEKEILEKIEYNQKRLDEIYISVERTRKYFLWALVITIVAVVLPLIGLLTIIPQFLRMITGEGLGL